MIQPSEFAATSTHDLLRVYAGVLRELFSRGVIRTLNAPAGDLSETLVARAYNGELAPNSTKSWDIRAEDGRLLQVKSRAIPERARNRQIEFSTFRSFDFDAVVFVIFATETYDVIGGFEVPRAEIEGRARVDKWVGGNAITPSMATLRAMPGVVDVTERLHSALMALP